MRQLSLVLALIFVSCAPEAPPASAPAEAPAPEPADAVAEEASEPMQEDLPGLLGTTEIVTAIPGHDGDQYWTDSDGVLPELAGCHFPFSGMDADGDCTGPLAPAGVFGEFCNPAEGEPMHQAGFPVGALIESNPEADACHPHKDGLGHPYVYDCDAYCKGTYTESHTGTCVADVCNSDGEIASARCECTPGAA